MKNTPTHRRPKPSARSSTGSTSWPTTPLRRPPASASNKPRTSRARWLRHIACISTSRADAGIYLPLLRQLSDEPRWNLSMLLGGTHHRAEFGDTAGHLANLRRCRVERIDHFVPGDAPAQVGATAGRAVEAFSRYFARRTPDLVFILGDRTEMLAATLAAVIHRIPIAHLHGGDITAGAYDDACRHALTKLSHLHFCAHPIHARRIAHMGEESWRIHRVGALALDPLSEFKPFFRIIMGRDWVINLKAPMAMIAFHPETLCDLPVKKQIAEVLSAASSLKMDLLLIGPNADVGHEDVQRELKRLALRRRIKVGYVASLSQPDFWNCLAQARVLIGNSSAGVIEAASFRVPVVNIGDRQSGRIKPANVIDAPFDRRQIAAAIRKALSPAFRRKISNLKNPYGDGRSAERICGVLRGLPGPAILLRKKFV